MSGVPTAHFCPSDEPRLLPRNRLRPTGQKHAVAASRKLLRQSIYSRLAGYEDVNDGEREYDGKTAGIAGFSFLKSLTNRRFLRRSKNDSISSRSARLSFGTLASSSILECPTTPHGVLHARKHSNRVARSNPRTAQNSSRTKQQRSRIGTDCRCAREAVSTKPPRTICSD